MPEATTTAATTPQWGMVIDIDKCTGCAACVAGCRSENNVPVVGPEAAAQGRDMAWIRIDARVEGEWPRLRVRFVPVLCQHCDEAPCVTACPVGATYETREGLNAQVYARCIGTRYCAVACPYTVRAFNFAEPEFERPLDQMLNPDVALRERGMIEKCSFCVQRIRRGEEQARDRGGPLDDGELKPACVQACPSEAMWFGDLARPDSQVATLARSPRARRLLEELGTRPRVVYLETSDSA